MRLIDAEKIPYTMLYKENWMSGTGKEAQGAWKSDIDKMPTIDAVPVRHGEWEFAYEDTNEELIFECSICKGFSTRENFCPHCGAKMDLKGDAE